MKRLWSVGIGLVISIFTSCTWISQSKETSLPVAPVIDRGGVLKPSLLENGGKLIVIPFKAGEGVTATAMMDKTSLMFIKGLADILQEENSNLEVVLANQAYEADFVMEGHITKIYAPSKIQRWFLRKKNREVAIKGKMVHRFSDEPIFIFTRSRMAPQKTSTYAQLGYWLGQDIGHFISSFEKTGNKQ